MKEGGKHSRRPFLLKLQSQIGLLQKERLVLGEWGLHKSVRALVNNGHELFQRIAVDFCNTHTQMRNSGSS